MSLEHHYDPAYYQKNKEHILEIRRVFRENNREILREQSRAFYQKDKVRRASIKIKVLAHYGHGTASCVRCGFDDIRALVLDHIVPICGDKNRKALGAYLYSSLLRDGFPSGYQTLCANCNLIKMFEGNEWTQGKN